MYTIKKMKQIKLNFRKTTTVYINDIPKVKCLIDSPQCLIEYIPTRLDQKMCLKCLIHHNLLNKHPLLDVNQIICKKIKIDTTFY